MRGKIETVTSENEDTCGERNGKGNVRDESVYRSCVSIVFMGVLMSASCRSVIGTLGVRLRAR